MSRLIGISVHRLAGLAICEDLEGKWVILRGPHKGLEPRVLGFWPRARLSYLATHRLIGESASLVAGMAICMDFARKMGAFEAAC